MGVEHAGLMKFGAAHHYTVAFALHHPQKQIRIELIFRSFAAVSFWVGHGAVHYQVFQLNPVPIFFEPLVVIGTVFLIAFVGNAEHRVCGIQSDAPLKTAGGYITAVALHDHLVH